MKGDCKYDETQASSAKVKTYAKAESGDIEMIKRALSHQPIAATVNANNNAFTYFASGVLTYEGCSDDNNHAVVIVGYGTDSHGIDYWIVKNSWGSDWGESGYINIGINPYGSGVCGI